jgi:hypothetical protein
VIGSRVSAYAVALLPLQCAPLIDAQLCAASAVMRLLQVNSLWLASLPAKIDPCTIAVQQPAAQEKAFAVVMHSRDGSRRPSTGHLFDMTSSRHRWWCFAACALNCAHAGKVGARRPAGVLSCQLQVLLESAVTEWGRSMGQLTTQCID